LATAGNHTVTQTLDRRLLRNTSALPDFAAWARAHLPAGTLIANPCWADFPLLFYSLPDYRFSLGLDPMFAHHAHPQAVVKLEQFRARRLDLTPAELAELTGARVAFVSRHAAPLARHLLARHYAAAYAGPDGWLFDLGRTISPSTDRSL
jgi:hypothetical protein